MTHRPYRDIIQELVRCIRETSHPQETSFQLFVNCEGSDYSFGNTTPEQLKDRGISMRNLKGEFIK